MHPRVGKKQTLQDTQQITNQISLCSLWPKKIASYLLIMPSVEALALKKDPKEVVRAFEIWFLWKI